MLNHGVLVVLLRVSLVFAVVVLTVPDRVLTETCAVVVVCLPPPRPGAVGIAKLMSTRNVMPFARLLLLLASQPWLCPKVLILICYVRT